MSGYYNITFSCGHTERVLIEGNLAQQKHELSCKQTKICSKCFNARRHKQVVADSKDLPALKGTEKQIIFAMSLRLDMINALKERIEDTVVVKSGANQKTEEEMIKMAKEKCNDHQYDIFIEKVNEYKDLVNQLKMLETEESAVWFIEKHNS